MPGLWTSIKRRRAIGAAAALAGLAGLAALALGGGGSWPVVQVIPRAAIPFDFSPDGRTLTVNLYQAGGFAAIDLATLGERAVSRDEVFFGVQRSPDGRLLLQINNLEGVARVVEATTGAEVRRLAAESGPISAVFAPDGAAILIFGGPADHADEVRTWDLATGVVSRRPLSKPPGLVPGAFRGRSYLWQISPDGRTLAYFDDARVGIQLWDVATDRALGPVLRTPTTQLSPFNTALAFTPDARFLLHGRHDGRVEVWDVARRALDRVLVVQTADDVIHNLTPSPDGRTLLVHSWPVTRGPVAWGLGLVQVALRRVGVRREEDQTVLVDLASGRRLARVPGGDAAVFSPDGRFVALMGLNRVTIHHVPTPGRP